MTESISTREKMRSIVRLVRHRPLFTVGIVIFSFFTALLEGIGLSFIVPIVELLQGTDDPAAEADGLLRLFVLTYGRLGIPFTIETVIAGAMLVMTLRFTASFAAAWLREKLIVEYVRDLQTEAVEKLLSARVGLFEQKGSDTILNAVVTQAPYSGSVVYQFVNLWQTALICAIYLAVAFFLSPSLTIFACAVLGGITYLLYEVVDSGYDLGDQVAQANERLQTAVQRGSHGIRDVKLFGMYDEIYHDFRGAAADYAELSIALRRNDATINNLHQLLSAVFIFVLIYVGYRFSSLSLSALGVFLFAMFRLAPMASQLTQIAYNLDGALPHHIRTYRFIDELEGYQEPSEASRPVPDTVRRVAFRDVSFSYPSGEEALRNVTLSVDRGEFVAFVGPSGAGKSTIVSLLARLRDSEAGTITANGIPIDTFDIREWRSTVAVVRQDPFIFNDTLRYNLTIGNRDVPDAELDRVCELACVSEFFDDLPDGYETVLSEDGVKLSGGQRQRVAIARALLTDSEILILDEATSELDSSIERDVYQGIRSLQSDRTILAVAHRLSTITETDRIYTVRDGQIIRSGTHEELLAEDGIYADLYAIQSRSRSG